MSGDIQTVHLPKQPRRLQYGKATKYFYLYDIYVEDKDAS